MIINLPKLGPVRFDDNLTEAQLNARVNELAKKYDFKVPVPEFGLGETFTRGVKRGTQQLGILGGDVLPAMIGKGLGFEDYAARQMEEAAASQQEIARQRPPVFESYKQVESPYQALQFGIEVIGEQIPNIATSLIPGLGLGAVTGRAALTSTGKALATQAAERGLVGEAATAFVTEGMKRAAPQIAAKAQTGQNVGIFLGSYAQNAPEIFQNIVQETGQMEVGTSLLFGAGAAALDSILPAQLARQLSGPMKAGIVEKVLEKSGMDRGILRSTTSGLVKGTTGEGLTEGAQEALSIAAEKFVADNPQVFGSKEWDRIMEASVRGAIAGGGFGVAGGSVERMREASQRKAELADALERRGQRQEAARLRKEVEEANTQIAAIESGKTQMELPGLETGAYTTLYEPEEVTKKAAEGAKNKLGGKQLEMFGPEGELTKQAEKAATADEKRAVNVARQQAKKEATELKQYQDNLKKFLGAKQLTLPGMSPEEVAAAQQQQAALEEQIKTTGQGDLFSGMPAVEPTAEVTTEVAPVEEAVAEPTKVTPPSGIEGTIISADKAGLAALGKQLGIGRTAKILREDGPLAGKDLSDPAQAAEVKQVLEAYASGKPAEGAAAKIEEFLLRPEFQVAPVEVPSEPTAQFDAGRNELSVPSDITDGTERVGDRGAGELTEPISGGLDETGLAAGDVDVREEDTGRPLGVKETKDVARAEAATEEAVRQQANFVTRNDERTNNILTGLLREAAAAEGIDPKFLPAEDLRGTPEHSYLRLPSLINEYLRLRDLLGIPPTTPAERAQAARNQQEFEVIRDAILQSDPNMPQFLQNMEASTPAQREQVLSQINREAISQFAPVIEKRIASLRLEEEEREATKPKAKLTEADLDQLADEFNERLFEKTGKKLFLPAHRGPDLSDAGRTLVESGDLKGVIDYLRNSVKSKAVQQILNKIKTLNLGTKIVVGNPETGMFALGRRIEDWFKGIDKAAVTPDKGKNKLVQMPIDQFLKLAERDAPGSRLDKEQRVQDIINKSEKFSEVPYLYIEIDANGNAKVTGHEGRHRARALKALGYDTIPVELRSNIRWSEQQNSESFDYKQNWPTTLVGENGDVVPFPVSRGKTNTQYTPIAAETESKLYQGKAGSFDPRTNTITISPEMGMNEHTLLHELMHAAISHVLRNPNLPVTKQLTSLFTQIQNQMGAAYGAQDLQEFAAELVSNPEFQALLKTIKAPKSQNMFVRFMQTLAEFFGFAKGTNAYDKGLKLVSDAIDISADVDPSPADVLFLGTPNGAAMGLGVVGRVGQTMPALAGRTVEETKNYLSNMPGDAQSIAMGLLRLDNINTIYGKELPSLQKLLDALERRNGMQEKYIRRINENYKRFLEVESRHPQAMQRMNDMAIDARLEQVDLLDPKFKPSAAQLAQYNRLKNVYNGLPDDVKKVYRDIRGEYDAAINEYEDILLNSVQDPSIRRKLKAQYEAKKRQIGYIPFLRRGDFWVEYDENGERAAQAFQSQRERQIFIDSQLKGKSYKVYQNINEATFNQSTLPSSSFIVGLMGELNKQGASDQLKQNVYQSYLALFPAESLAKNFMKSENVRGMERDIVRGYGETMIKWARKLSSSKYNPEIDRALSEIATQGSEASTKPNGAGAYAAAQNVMDQASFLHNPTYGKLVSAATTLSYFNYIAGNVSSALVNLTTLPMFSWSILGAKFGFDKSSTALLSASKTTIDYIFNNKVPSKYAKLFDVLNDHAQLEHTMAREVLEGRRQTTSEFTGTKARVMDILSIPFSKTEVLNRGATAIAAYDLARGSGMKEDDAIRYALNTVKEINTSGLSSTAPRYMQHPAGRIFFTFKSFVWNTAFVVGRAFHQAVKGESTAVRKEAFRQLIGIYGMAMAFAGIKGLPFMGAISTLATVINSLLGDDDEPYDFDVMMRGWTNELFYKGLINYATNLEVANRVGVANDLLFRDDPKGVAENGYVLTAMKQAFGPAGSFAASVGDGAKQVSEGNVARGIEAMLPTFLKNGFKAWRYASEGVTNRKGELVIDDISSYNIAMQVIGFSPANLSNVYEEIGMKKDFERKVMAQRSKLLNKYDMARRAGDSDLLIETLEEIGEYNEKRKDPKAKITQDTLSRSVRAREAAERDSVNGVRFNKNLRTEIDELLEEYEE
jgi:hypothetical protein